MNELIRKGGDLFRDEGLTALLRGGTKSLYRRVTSKVVNYAYIDNLLTTDILRAEFLEYDLPDETAHLSVETCRESIPLQSSNQSLQFLNRPFFKFTSPFVATVPNATVIGRLPVGVSADGRIIADTIYFDAPHETKRFHEWLLEASLDNPVQLALTVYTGKARSYRESVEVGCVIGGYVTGNYYHWVMEAILRIRGARYYEQQTGNEVSLIVRGDPPLFAKELLSALGYGPGEYIEADGRPLFVETLVTPSHPEPTPKTIKWLQEELLSSFQKTDTKSSPRTADWVYLSRQNAQKGRKVRNFSQIREVLQEYDVEIVSPQELTLEEEVQMIANAEGVIGPHGAGLTAIIWSEELTLIELFNGVINAPYYIISSVLGYDYVASAHEPVGDYDESRNMNIFVDVERFAATVAEVIGE